jgi:O-antigen/teichoic acid export membrane protein
VQVAIALLTTLATATVAWFAPAIFDDIPPDQVRDSQLIIAFLGLNLAVRMLFWPVRAILTGYHYWNITAAVTAFGDILLLIGMYVALKTGGGLAELGMVAFSLALFTETLRFIIARRIYPFRMLIPSSVHWPTMRKMIGFGVTNNLTGLSWVLVIQTTAVVLAASAGPAALAVLARPLALFQHVGTLVKLYAFLLTPMAASLQGLKREGDLKSALLTALVSSFAMTIPPVALLTGYGDVIIELWMGKDYVVPVLAPILGASLILPYAHMVAMRILVGVDAHTRVAAWSLGVTVVVLAAGIWAAGTIGWSTATAAVVVGASLLPGPGIVVIVGACRRFGVGFGEYLSRALLAPLMCNLPLLAIIAASRYFDEHVTIVEAAVWGLAGGLSAVGLYWKFLLTEKVRARLARKLGFRRRTETATAVD